MAPLCEQNQNLLSAYIDGRLSSEKAWSVQMHLALCNDCSSALTELNRTVALLQTVQPKTLSASFDDKLKARIAAARLDQAAHVPARASQGLMARLADGFNGRSVRRPWALAIAGGSGAACLAVAALLQPGRAPTSIRTAVQPAVHAVAPSSDAVFIAACTSENAKYVSNQALADPMAQTLAARADATGIHAASLSDSPSY